MTLGRVAKEGSKFWISGLAPFKGQCAGFRGEIPCFAPFPLAWTIVVGCSQFSLDSFILPMATGFSSRPPLPWHSPALASPCPPDGSKAFSTYLLPSELTPNSPSWYCSSSQTMPQPSFLSNSNVSILEPEVTKWGFFLQASSSLFYSAPLLENLCYDYAVLSSKASCAQVPPSLSQVQG